MHNCPAATYPFTATPYVGLAGRHAVRHGNLCYTHLAYPPEGELLLLHTLPCARRLQRAPGTLCLCCSWGPRQPTCKPLLWITQDLCVSH